MPTLVGKRAPDFSAKAVVNGKIVENFTISQFQGKKYVILFFYPKDFTFVLSSNTAPQRTGISKGFYICLASKSILVETKIFTSVPSLMMAYVCNIIVYYSHYYKYKKKPDILLGKIPA